MAGAKHFSIPLLAAAGLGAIMLPGARRLPQYHPTTVNNVTTIDDAVLACRQSDLQGWNLVAFAQRLVAQKFTVYSTLNLWDPPGRAFRYGMGYCTQYNLALKQVLDRLGFVSTAVFSLKVRVLDDPDWTMGHTWLRVTAVGETRDVCAGRVDNEPGKVNFVPVSAVYPGRSFILFLTHLGMIGFCGFLEWHALLTGARPPDWSFVRR